MSRMHFERIDAADVVYVYNPQGYVGNSVLTEIGYSFGRGKPIYSSEPIQDPLIAGLIDKIIPKAKLVDELKKIV